jgi:hypothetical protein
MDLKEVFADGRPTPNAIQQLVFGDELTTRLTQNLENFKSSPTEWRGGATHSELASTKVDLALA